MIILENFVGVSLILFACAILITGIRKLRLAKPTQISDLSQGKYITLKGCLEGTDLHPSTLSKTPCAYSICTLYHLPSRFVAVPHWNHHAGNPKFLPEGDSEPIQIEITRIEGKADNGWNQNPIQGPFPIKEALDLVKEKGIPKDVSPFWRLEERILLPKETVYAHGKLETLPDGTNCLRVAILSKHSPKKTYWIAMACIAGSIFAFNLGIQILR